MTTRTRKSKPAFGGLIEIAGMAILLLPLFFINITGMHDWGGDFAQYIQQAINLAEGKKQSDTFYIINPHNPHMAPAAYPVGFPLILTPIYVLFGNSITAFTWHITAFLFAGMLATFYFLRQNFSIVWAAMATLLFAYNPWILLFKGEILSDIPFMLLVLLGALLYLKSNQSNTSAIIIGVTIGSAMLVKNIAVCVLLAIVLHQVWVFFTEHKKISTKQKLLFNGILISTAFGVYLLWSKLVLPTPQDTYSFSATMFSQQNIGETLLKNSNYYIDVFQGFFHNISNTWDFAAKLAKALLLTFFVIGLVSNKKASFPLLLTAVYLAVILCFPNTTQGFRYLLPVFPYILFYILCGMKSIAIQGKIAPHIIPVFISITMLFQSLNGLQWVAYQTEITDGPQRPHAQEAFEFIKNQTLDDAVFVFNKPRVLGLYGQRYSWANHPRQPYPFIEKELTELPWTHVMVGEHLPNEPLDSFVVANSHSLELIFDNSAFQIYQRL